MAENGLRYQVAFVLWEDVRLLSGDLPPFRGARNDGPTRIDRALPRACLLSLLRAGRLLAIYRSRALSVFPCASAYPDGAVLDARHRDRLPHRRNGLPQLVLSARQAAAL